jgi:hypothetical protein
MTDTEILNQIRKLIANEAPTPLPPPIEENLRALAADWMESDQHHVYGQTILDVLSGK